MRHAAWGYMCMVVHETYWAHGEVLPCARSCEKFCCSTILLSCASVYCWLRGVVEGQTVKQPPRLQTHCGQVSRSGCSGWSQLSHMVVGCIPCEPISSPAPHKRMPSRSNTCTLPYLVAHVVNYLVWLVQALSHLAHSLHHTLEPASQKMQLSREA